MSHWDWSRAAIEYLGGQRDTLPGGAVPTLRSWLWGVWWSLLVMIIILFGGQSSKFIYIDF